MDTNIFKEHETTGKVIINSDHPNKDIVTDWVREEVHKDTLPSDSLYKIASEIWDVVVNNEGNEDIESIYLIYLNDLLDKDLMQILFQEETDTEYATYTSIREIMIRAYNVYVDSLYFSGCRLYQ